MKTKLVLLIVGFAGWLVLGSQLVLAAGVTTPTDQLGLQPITIPTFLSVDFIKNFSVFSYIAFAISFIFVAISIFWVYLIIRAAVEIIQSGGDESKIENSKKRFGNVFWSVTFLFGFFIILNLVGAFLNLGTFLNWPRAFSICQQGFGKGKYYFNYFLEVQSKAGQYASLDDVNRQVEKDCFGS